MPLTTSLRALCRYSPSHRTTTSSGPRTTSRARFHTTEQASPSRTASLQQSQQRQKHLTQSSPRRRLKRARTTWARRCRTLSATTSPAMRRSPLRALALLAGRATSTTGSVTGSTPGRCKPLLSGCQRSFSKQQQHSLLQRSSRNTACMVQFHLPQQAAQQALLSSPQYSFRVLGKVLG